MSLNMSLEEVYASLSLRFLYPIFTPKFQYSLKNGKADAIIKLFFVLEEAHWFFLDFYVDKYTLKKLNFKDFCYGILGYCDLSYLITKESFCDFTKHKFSLPVCGTLIVNENHDSILLVRGYGKSGRLFFPCGKLKVDVQENKMECAIRETYEEIGFDVRNNIVMDSILEVDKRITLFIVNNVSKSINYKPIARNEIKEIKWVTLKSILNEETQKDLLDVKNVVMKFEHILDNYFDKKFKIDTSKIVKYFNIEK